jgi:hypothetical protein
MQHICSNGIIEQTVAKPCPQHSRDGQDCLAELKSLIPVQKKRQNKRFPITDLSKYRLQNRFFEIQYHAM